MVFGYALAVIAGFLLTAVKTWTNQPMPYGWHLGRYLGRGRYLAFIWFGLHVTPSIALFMAAFVFDMIFWGMTAFCCHQSGVGCSPKTSNWYHYQTFTIRFDSGCFYVGVLINHHNTQQIAFIFCLIFGDWCSVYHCTACFAILYYQRHQRQS